jgi:hypothetical protein
VKKLRDYPNYNLNADGSFMTEDQIVEDILEKRIDDDVRRILKDNFNPPLTEDEKLLGFNPYAFAQSSFGRWIRNSYGLWSMDNPHVVLNPSPNKIGVVDHPMFPDNLAGRIIDKLVQRLSEKCAGCSLKGQDHIPTFYLTPPKGVCSNLQEDGPTPCWYPHCVREYSPLRDAPEYRPLREAQAKKVEQLLKQTVVGRIVRFFRAWLFA